jgi:hypothetical protein
MLLTPNHVVQYLYSNLQNGEVVENAADVVSRSRMVVVVEQRPMLSRLNLDREAIFAPPDIGIRFLLFHSLFIAVWSSFAQLFRQF